MNTPELDGISVLVDGGCLNNNKPVSERRMYGSMTVFHGDRQVASTIELHTEPARTHRALIHKYSLVDQDGHASNNMAEVIMLRSALEYSLSLVLRQAGQAKPKKIDCITVLSDSEWALSVATGAYRIKPHNEAAFHNELTTIRYITEQLEKQGVTLIFQHVGNLWVKSVLGH